MWSHGLQHNRLPCPSLSPIELVKLYTKSCKTLVKEIKDDIKGWREIPWRINAVPITILQSDKQNQCYPYQITNGILERTRTKILQCVSVQFTQSCPTLCNPVNHTTPGLPVHHQLPESTQIHVHWVSDAIQPSHPLLSPSSPAFNLSQHQGLFIWVSSSHQVAKVLEFQPQYQSFQRTPRTDLL